MFDFIKRKYQQRLLRNMMDKPKQPQIMKEVIMIEE